MKTLLIFAYECYPYNRIGSSIGAQRPFHFANNLAALGWKIIVICCDNSARRAIDKVDITSVITEKYKEYEERFRSDAVTIIPLPSLKYYGFFDYVWYKSVKMGKGDTFVPKGFPYSVVRKMSTIYNQLFHGDYSYSWTPVAKEFSELLLKNNKVDIILGEHSPDAGIILASQISKLHQIPWVADFRDPVLSPFTGVLKFLYTPVVKQIVKSASSIIGVNPYWTTLDKELFDKKSYTVFNGFDQKAFENIPLYQFSKFTVSYFGSFNDKFQDVLPSLKAFALFVKKKTAYQSSVLFYRGLYHEKYKQLALEAGVRLENMDISGQVDRNNVVSFMKGSHVLLIYSTPVYMSRSRYEKKGFLPGKVFEFIGANRSILHVPTDKGMLEEFLKENNRGASCSTITEATLYLESQYESYIKEEFVEPLNKANLAYSRMAQSRILNEILSSCLQYKSS